MPELICKYQLFYTNQSEESLTNKITNIKKRANNRRSILSHSIGPLGLYNNRFHDMFTYKTPHPGYF